MVIEFKKAERRQAKLRLALCSPSGGGKTFSALKIAKGLGGKIAMIDTEHGSGSLYADTVNMPEYAVL
ncbi:MAG: AAA family ATPase, partial [Dehalococcoidia bacterium]|nr:AAA family ATPase [Dehalococcoidia bacterium]